MKFDVAVIGCGPAGLTASIFAARAGRSTICFEKLAVGGQACLSVEIQNYPAISSISGFDLIQNMFEQAKSSGAQFVFEAAKKVRKIKNGFSIKTSTQTYHAQKVIIAVGCAQKKLGLGEEKFVGKGISYCASCDGYFFKGKTVAVVGGGDSAFSYAEYLSRIAKKVYLLNRSEKFKADNSRVNIVKKIKNVKILLNTQITNLNGKDTLQSITLNDETILPVSGVFVAIGHTPHIDFLDFELATDNHGYVIVDQHMQTSVKNVYACGDITSKDFRQIITACAEGAVAGNSCIGEN